MSGGFGGNNNNNYNGGGGRGRGGRGRNNYQGGRGGRGRGGGRNNHQGGRGQGGGSQALLNPCGSYTTTGNCQHGNNCKFAHVVTLHKTVEASTVVQQQNNNSNNNYNNRNNYSNNQKAPVSAVSIWESNGTIQIFTGSHDGYWRLFNANQQFQRTAETPMRGKVECLEVVQNSYLYCGFEAPCSKIPGVPCGQVHAWNLQNPTQPIEFFMDPNHLPYAHNQAVSAMTIGEGSAPPIVTGSKDGAIRIWTLSATDGKFNLVRTLPGHVREVTALVLIPGGNLLWSSSIDGTIRIWDISQAVPEQACQYCITKDTPGNPPASPGGGINPQGGANAAGVGHTMAVTSMVLFTSAAGSFVLSSSLDGSIKAWDTSNAQCVASESHSEGVVTMTLANAMPSPEQQPPPQDGKGPPVLLVGLESGNLACRNLVQTAKTPAFALLFVLAGKYSAGHQGAVKAIAAGPSATFYSGGNDGNLMVWQFTGDLML